MAADITVFDPATIHDVATFEDPTHYSVGIKWVLVNGRASSSPTAASPPSGRAASLRGPGAPRRVATRDAAGLVDAQR